MPECNFGNFAAISDFKLGNVPKICIFFLNFIESHLPQRGKNSAILGAEFWLSF